MRVQNLSYLQACAYGTPEAEIRRSNAAPNVMSTDLSEYVIAAMTGEAGAARIIGTYSDAARSRFSKWRKRIVYPPPPVHQRSRPPPAISRRPAIICGLFRFVV